MKLFIHLFPFFNNCCCFKTSYNSLNFFIIHAKILKIHTKYVLIHHFKKHCYKALKLG